MQVSFKRIGGVAILSSLVFAAALFFSGCTKSDAGISA